MGDERALACSAVSLIQQAKTHQCIAIAKDFGAATPLTVSSVDMAAYFVSDASLRDITIAIPVNVLELPRIDELAATADIGVTVDSLGAVQHLCDALTHRVSVWIEIDAGYGRSGVPHTDTSRVVSIARAVLAAPAGVLRFRGLLNHAGNTYHERTRDGVQRVWRDSLAALCQLRRALAEHGVDQCELSVGDTPSCALVDSFDGGVSEVRPGNFVFFDLMQLQIGACRGDELSLAVACPIISVQRERRAVVVYGGGVHFAKDQLLDADAQPLLGRLTTVDERGRFTGPLAGVAMRGMSQEHGTLVFDDVRWLDQLQIGDVLLVLPVHACMTADLFDSFLTTDGERLTRRQRQR